MLIKLSVIAIGLLAATLNSAWAAQAKVTSGFVGFTTTTIDGGQGMLQMHALCQIDHGPSARMCTSKEFWLSPKAIAPTASAAWLHPTSFNDTLGDFSLADRACFGWTGVTSPSASGLIVAITGKPSFASCDSQLLVTCCVK